MFIVCPCGTRNSAFNPRCVGCGAPIVEPRKAIDAAFVAATERPLGPGDRAGEYVIQALLGSGTIGRVFRARHDGGALAALKVLHPHRVRDAEARARFVREARALSGVRHPSVGRIHEVFEAGGSLVLALELYEGSSLREILDVHRKVRPSAAVPILRELVGALGALHEAGWVHRDLKPENVMILPARAERTAEVRLLDFGLVRPLDVAPDGVRTAAGTFVGSLAYAAPEQILGEEVTPAADWWSLGVVAFEMLSGRRPFEGGTRATLARSLLRDEAPVLDVGRGLSSWVGALLAKEPARRSAAWGDVLARLEAASR